jgi:hypothetical protein
MNDPILDELETWIKRARALNHLDFRDMTDKEIEDWKKVLGDYDLILGPFGIDRIRST